MQTKLIPIQPAGLLMNSNLGKVNQLKCLKSKQETKFSPHLVILLKHLTTIIFTSIGQSPAQEIPTLEIDPLSFVQKAIKLLKAIDVGRASGLDKIPNRLLKIADDVVAPSLTGIF